MTEVWPKENCHFWSRELAIRKVIERPWRPHSTSTAWCSVVGGSFPWLPQQFLMTSYHLCPALPSSFLVYIWDISDSLSAFRPWEVCRGNRGDAERQATWVSLHISSSASGSPCLPLKATPVSRSPETSCAVSEKEGSWWLVLADEMGC